MGTITGHGMTAADVVARHARTTPDGPALADPRTAGIFVGGVSIVGAPHPGFLRMPASPAHLLGMWGLDDTVIPYEASEDAPGPDVALATVDEADERGWYYTAARNVTRAWSLHHGGPAAPVSTAAKKSSQ